MKICKYTFRTCQFIARNGSFSICDMHRARIGEKSNTSPLPFTECDNRRFASRPTDRLTDVYTGIVNNSSRSVSYVLALRSLEVHIALARNGHPHTRTDHPQWHTPEFEWAVCELSCTWCSTARVHYTCPSLSWGSTDEAVVVPVCVPVDTPPRSLCCRWPW